MSRLRLIVAAALALVLVLPATALAATTPIGGTVTAEGAAVAGAEITVLVQGTDQILSTTSDANGAWALEVDVDAGAVIEVNGTGKTTTSEPDKDGCVTSTTPSGQVLVTVPEGGEVAPVDVALDTLLTGKVCSTATPPNTGGGNGGNGGGSDKPAQHKPAHAGLTPPSTDTISIGTATTAGDGAMLVIGALVVLTTIVLATTSGRRSRRPASVPVRSRRR